MAKNTKVNSAVVEKVQDSVIAAYDQQEEGNVTLNTRTVEALIDILDWCAERLEKQRENSKIYQKKNTLVRKLIEEQLSKDELDAINVRAREIVENL